MVTTANPLSNDSQPTARQPDSVSPPRRLGARTATDAASVATPFLEPLLRAKANVPVQLIAGIFPVDEIAEPPSYTALATI